MASSRGKSSSGGNGDKKRDQTRERGGDNASRTKKSRKKGKHNRISGADRDLHLQKEDGRPQQFKAGVHSRANDNAGPQAPYASLPLRERLMQSSIPGDHSKQFEGPSGSSRHL
jgi:hypothetical protein